MLMLDFFSFIRKIGVSGITLPLNVKSGNSGQLFFSPMLQKETYVSIHYSNT